MKNRILFSIILTLFSFVFTVAAKQEKYTKHIVGKGETINNIAQKYKVTPYDITDVLIDNYEATRNFPAMNKTSYLGIYLRFGVVSIRKMVSNFGASV